ncbi:MAG: trigger factor [Nitrospirae bacterium]|nr:trigger factor [Nitrospirota bacterium]MCL5423175.1 trigger factor [Nitrospirota bacterium]
MLKSVEDITATKKRLRIEIPAETIEKEIRESFEKLRRKTTIPGFRTGKAPMQLIEKRFGKDVEQDVLDRIVPHGYVEALKEADITPAANPVLEDKFDFKRNQPLSMTLTVEIMPKIENLNYENIAVKDIPVTVSDEDIESVLQRQQEEKATYEPSDGPVDMNDLVVLDYSAQAEEIEAKDQVFKVGGSMFPGDFSEKLMGKHKGDEVVIETTFPADHPSGKVAGKHLSLNVTVKDIKKVHLPAIDDELAKDIGFENLEEMKKRIGEEIEKAKKNEVAKMQKAELLKKLIESHEFPVPESLVENEAAALASAVLADRRQQSADEKDPEALKQELGPNAVRNVKASLLIEAIGKAQGVSVTDDELKGAIVSLAQRLSVSPENIMKFYISRDGSLDGLRNTLFEDKVLDLILSKASVEKGE